jgi:restriction endonuclease S subunit/predicted ATPase
VQHFNHHLEPAAYILTMPDKLPRGWVKTTLGEVCLSVPMVQPSVTPENVFTYFDIGGIDSESNRIADAKTVTGSGAPSRARQAARMGDILFSNVRTYLKKIARIEHDYSNPIASTGFTVIRPAVGVSSQFLFYLILSDKFLQPIHALQSGSSYPAVREKDVFAQAIPLPPFREQERIVAKLDASMSRLAAGEAAARRALERLKRYRSSVLYAAVTGELTREWRNTHKPDETGHQLLNRLIKERRVLWEECELKRLNNEVKPPKDDKWKQRYPKPAEPKTSKRSELPKGWIWAGWEQVGFSQNGKPFPSKEYTKSGIKLLRPGNLFPDGTVRWNEKNTRCLPTKYEHLNPDHIIGGEELVINLTAQSLKDEFLGRVCLTTPSEHCLLNQRLARLTPVAGEPKFFLFMFKSSVFRRFVADLNSGSLIQHMFTSQLGEFYFPLPPAAEQAEIVRQVERRLESGDRLAAALTRQLERAVDTRQSLLREAFAGKLVPQDPKDEPALLLLDRIRVARIADAEAQKQARKASDKTAPNRTNETADMNQSIPTTDALQKAWQKIGKKPDAKKLFQAVGFAPDQAVSFYELLRTAPEIVKVFKTASRKGKTASKLSVVKAKRAKQKPGRFRLVSLWLEDFKNLKNYTVHFDSKFGLDIILGWNGTGKSNLFESLVIIFRDLHYWWEKNNWTIAPMAGYRLAYEIEDHIVEVNWNPAQMKRPEIRLAAIPTKLDTELQFKSIKREDLPLPKFVFGYYSGPTNRLADHFWPMKRDHYERLRKTSSDDPKTLAMLLEQRRFFCAEASHAKYVLLAFSYKEDPKIWKFLEDRLRIVGFESALFVIRKPRWAKGKPQDFWGATGIMRRVMEKLKRYAIAPMVLEQKVADGYRLLSEELYYFFLPDLKSLHEFAAEYADARSFFLVLESTDFSELIHDVKIQVRVKDVDKNNIPITFRELSEGEQQLLMVLGLMRFTKSHQSLVLLDEPDTHLNPHWSVEYLKDLASVVSDDDDPSPEQQTSQLLMATHDPLVIASLVKEQVHLLKRDPDTLVCRSEQASVNPKGLGFTGILTSEMFGFRSDLDPETLADLDNRVRLIAKESKLTGKEKKELADIDNRLTEAGFSKAFSDPYYAAFVRAWGRRYAEQMTGKAVLTKKDSEEIDRIAREILAEAVAEVEREGEDSALH